MSSGDKPKLKKKSLFSPKNNATDTTSIRILFCAVRTKRLCRPRLERHLLWVNHKQDWDLRFIFLLPQAAVLPESDARSSGVEPASRFLIQSHQISCSLWFPMYEYRAGC